MSEPALYAALFLRLVRADPAALLEAEMELTEAFQLPAAFRLHWQAHQVAVAEAQLARAFLEAPAVMAATLGLVGVVVLLLCQPTVALAAMADKGSSS